KPLGSFLVFCQGIPVCNISFFLKLCFILLLIILSTGQCKQHKYDRCKSQVSHNNLLLMELFNLLTTQPCLSRKGILESSYQNFYFTSILISCRIFREELPILSV